MALEPEVIASAKLSNHFEKFKWGPGGRLDLSLSSEEKSKIFFDLGGSPFYDEPSRECFINDESLDTSLKDCFKDSNYVLYQCWNEFEYIQSSIFSGVYDIVHSVAENAINLSIEIKNIDQDLLDSINNSNNKSQEILDRLSKINRNAMNDVQGLTNEIQ